MGTWLRALGGYHNAPYKADPWPPHTPSSSMNFHTFSPVLIFLALHPCGPSIVVEVSLRWHGGRLSLSLENAFPKAGQGGVVLEPFGVYMSNASLDLF